MAEFEFEEKSQPWARENARSIPCPYCGKTTVLQSYGDISDDDIRVELYCNYSYCDVREFTILALRTNGRVQRADAIALEEIDSGTAEERLPEVMNLTSPSDSKLIQIHSRGILPRRRRRVKIEITPVFPSAL